MKIQDQNFTWNSIPFKGAYWLLIFFFIFSSCDLTPYEEFQINQVNTIFFGNQPVEFVSAKLSITGPQDVSGPNSHYRATLFLSTDIEFREPYIGNSSVLRVDIHSIDKGVSLPTFPLQEGEYIVFPPAEITDQNILVNLSEKNFTLGPIAGINYLPNQSNFNVNHEAQSGFMTIRFDLPTNRVVVTHNWKTKTGLEIKGTNNLPINLSQFVP
ncbi:hypothetical protein [Shivajiella indica]|uniref:DUF1735 domain-containing protein n=1 Tax=Shivajiella indica TaxID=872115 RepID=A0ABW5B606_9BACT